MRTLNIVIRTAIIAGLIGWAIGRDFAPRKVVTRELTPTEIELILKAVGRQYGGLCL